MVYYGMCLFTYWMIQNRGKVIRKILKIEGFQAETIIRRFTITIPVFILSIFWQLLLKYWEISSLHTACDNNKVSSQLL